MANKRDTVKTCGTKRSDLLFLPFGFDKKAERAAFYMFILFFRVPLKESGGAVYQPGR